MLHDVTHTTANIATGRQQQIVHDRYRSSEIVMEENGTQNESSVRPEKMPPANKVKPAMKTLRLPGREDETFVMMSRSETSDQR